MNIVVGCQYEFIHELRYGAELDSMPLYSETVMDDVADLIEETYVRGVLSEILPLEIDTLQVDVQPIWQHEPVAAGIRISLAAFRNGSALTAVSQDFARGRWVRTANAVAIRKHEQGELAEGQAVHRVLLGMKRRNPPAVQLPPLAPPSFADQSLEACGVRALGAGCLVADRPVLVNQRLAADAIRCCEQAGTTETGGAVLGKIVRLRDPLPQTTTRFATLLSMVVEDPRHVGAPLSFTFSLEGLAEAATFGALRGFGETVQTAFHTHGWNGRCGNCNQDPRCPLAECHPSLQDYQLLESMFSSKSTLLPIAGRKLGAPGRRPVLQIHAWRGGEMQPISWLEYYD